jgi:hypothetical protein
MNHYLVICLTNGIVQTRTTYTDRGRALAHAAQWERPNPFHDFTAIMVEMHDVTAVYVNDHSVALMTDILP